MSARTDETRSGRRGSVFVTGASSGIGLATTRGLRARGFHVFATVLNDSELERFRDEPPDEVTPLVVDTTRGEHIAGAAELVAERVGQRGLAGLVSNAGAAVGGALEHLPLGTFRHQIELNLIGHVAVTQALLGQIRRGRGRVVFVGSPSGTLVLPFLASYSAPKAGLKAVAESLRLELAPSGIPVSLIEPGRTATAIWDQSRDDTLESLRDYPEEGRDRYAAQIAAQIRLTYGSARSAPGPDKVARAVVHALTAHRPRPRYYVGLDCKLLSLAAHLVPTRARDLAILWILSRLRDG